MTVDTGLTSLYIMGMREVIMLTAIVVVVVFAALVNLGTLWENVVLWFSEIRRGGGGV